MIVFEQFLINNKCRDKYWRNLQDSNKDNYIKNAIDSKKCLLKELFTLYIVDSFLWAHAEEGHEFWSDLDDLWTDLVDDTNLVYFGFGIDYDLEKGESLC